MAKKLVIDRTLFITAVALVLFGLLMTYSASALVAQEARLSAHFFLIKQGLWALLGLPLVAALMSIDYRRRLDHPATVYTLLAITVVLLVAVLFAPPIKNAHRWLRLGLLSFQPSELAKLALVVTLAFQLSRRVDRLSDFLSGLAPSLLVTAFLSFLVLMEPDFGTASILVVVAGTMFFVAGAPLGHLARLVLLAAPLVYLLVSQVDYRRDRWLAFLAPWDDALGGGFQAVQAQIAVGSGGWMGRGFMQSRQKLFFLPEPHTDFVYAVVGEELGLVGTIGVLVCFSVLLWRGLTIARRAPDVFGSLLAAGLTAMLALQAFMNMGVVLSLLPTTGIPLPFISSGGSSLLCSMLAVGVLLSVSQHAR